MDKKSQKKSVKINKFRISIFRSNKSISAQLIDDEKRATLAAVSSLEIKEKGKPTEIALKAGKLLAEKAKEKKIANVYFDRNGYRYHGRVKAMAEGMRRGGLEF